MSNYCADAIYRDPPSDRDFPAQTTAFPIPSGGLNLNALLYLAAGKGPHPTILLLHGLPGNEQNIDLAQSMRRSGWNVLTIHYRGSWGGPGEFSFANCLDDAAAALEWLRRRAEDSDTRINAARMVVIGHSMGGFVAAATAADASDLVGAVLISGVDLGLAFGTGGEGAREVDDNVGISAGLHILEGTSATSLAEEARANAHRWNLAHFANRLAGRPMLLVTAQDGFASGSDALAEAISGSGGGATKAHFPTDHSYSDCRIALQTLILNWLNTPLSADSI